MFGLLLRVNYDWGTYGIDSSYNFSTKQIN
jgi:hypothetical protein